ncbi:MAG: hypothetical protein ABIP51_17820 [Bacteroidia bacterium]
MGISFLRILILLCVSARIIAQNLNHPSVSNLEVNYKTIMQPTISATSSTVTNNKVVAQVTISLINTNNIKNIFFKIVNSSGAIEYQANYDITGINTINAPNGRKLFYYNNGIVYLNSPQQLIPAPYLFQVFTKNNTGNASPVFSITQ